MPYKYIQDSAIFPFENVVLKIENIVDELGVCLPFNQSNVTGSIANPTYNSIQIPSPSADNAVGVTYRAAHSIILVPNLRPSQTEIDMPLSLMQPLLLFVAHRAYASIADEMEVSNNFLIKYEKECADIKALGLINSDQLLNKKLENSGWE